MRSFVARISAVGMALVVAGFLAPQAATASAAPRSFSDCMDIAVEHDADVWIAHDACESTSITACYRIFRDEYGRQEWALRACKARDDQRSDASAS
ncbi:putative secreted protein [Saccharothrix espanaensis DSM 44229]|uniref:Putative secreted protein n=2 Tax=Saccharothrix espanaensis TaxID=103731 RepID=K0K0Q7_SACES|nr:putative secreted protein [Saccharothrix espanaensis DSM 44229]